MNQLNEPNSKKRKQQTIKKDSLNQLHQQINIYKINIKCSNPIKKLHIGAIFYEFNIVLTDSIKTPSNYSKKSQQTYHKSAKEN